VTRPALPAIEEERARYTCEGDDGTRLIVLEFRYVLRKQTSSGPRAYPGARRWALETGDAVRLLDRRTFEVVATGELIVLIGD
jgi:hypothetical protein